MAFSHGKNTVFKIDDSIGTLRDISTYLEDVDFPQPVETSETTTFGNTSKTFITGVKSSTISISGNFDPVADGYLSGILGMANTASFEYGPQGSTVGNIKYTGECICTAYNVKGAIGGAVKFTASFQVSGAVTRGTY